MTPINSGTNSEQLDYLLSLDEGGDLEWDRRVDKSDAIIELTDGSKYREDIPMAKAKFIFDRVTPEQLYKLLYDPPTRLSWDKDSLLKYTEFDVVEQSSVSYYMINKAPWPMKNRDFVGQRHIHRSLDGSLQVYEHSIESELYPVTDAAERGETIFGGQIFRPLEDYKLQVVFISQVDVKGALPPKLVKDTLPMQLMKWKTSVEKAIKTLIH